MFDEAVRDAAQAQQEKSGRDLRGPHLHEVSRGSTLDLLEVCAPWDSPLSAAVREAGGKAMSVGVHNGYDLSASEGFRKTAII